MANHHRVSLEKRFRTKYRVDPVSGCWVWTGGLSDHGYGRLSKPGGGGTMPAHRLSYELHKGPIPAGKFVLHSCDNPPCVNPDHLRVGSIKDNVRDSMERGRFKPPPNLYGEQVSTAKLTPDAVRHIWKREARLLAREYAALYGVSATTVTKIWRRERWTCVTKDLA